MPPNNTIHADGSPSPRSFFKIPFMHGKRSKLDQHEMETSAKSVASKSFSIKSLLALNKKPSKKETFASHPNINGAATSQDSSTKTKDQQSTQTVPHESRHEALNKSRRKPSSSPSDHSISSILSDKKSKSKNNKSKKEDLKKSRIPKPKPVRSHSSESLSSLSDSSSSTISLSSHFNSLQLKTDSDSAFKPPAELQQEQEQNVVDAEQINTCEQETEKNECPSITSEEVPLELHPGLLELLMKQLFLQSAVQPLGQQTANFGGKLPPGLSRTGRQMVVVDSVDGQVVVQNFYNSQDSLTSNSNLSNSRFGVINLMNGNNGNGYNNFLNYNKIPPNAVNSNDNQNAYNSSQYQQPQHNFQQANPFTSQMQNYPQQNGQFPHFNQWTPTNNISLSSVSSSSRSLYGNSRQNIASTSHLVPATSNHPGQMQQSPMQQMPFPGQFSSYQMNPAPVFVQQQNPLPNNFNFASVQTPVASASVQNNIYMQNQQPPQLNFNPPTPKNVLPHCQASTSRANVSNNVLPYCEPSTSRAGAPPNNGQATKRSGPVKEYLRCEWVTRKGELCSWKIKNNSNVYEDPIETLANHIKEQHTDKEAETGNMCRWNKCKRATGFKANYQLDLHLRKHSGYKPFKCEVPNCGKEYSRLENLKTHVRTHNSEDCVHFKKYAGFDEQVGKKPFVCNQIDKNGKICEKTFTNASDRAKHVNRTHSEARPYRCPVEIDGADCDKAYTDPSSLRKHIKTDHGELTWKRAQRNKQLIDEMGGKKKNGKKKYDYGKIYEWTQKLWPRWFEISRGLPIPPELNPENSRAVADSYNLDLLTMRRLQELLNQTEQVGRRIFIQKVITDLTNARDYPNQLYGVWEEQGGLYSVIPIHWLMHLLHDFYSITHPETVNALPPQQPNNNGFGPNGNSNSAVQFDSSYQPNGQSSQASNSRSSSGFYSNSSTPSSNYSNTYNNNNNNDSGFQGGFDKMHEFSFNSSIPNYSSDLLKQLPLDDYGGYLNVDENTGLLSRVEITQAVPKVEEDLTSYEPAVCNPLTDFAESSDFSPDPGDNNNALCQFFFNDLPKAEEPDDEESNETRLNKLINEFFKNLNIAHNKFSKQ